MAEGLEKRFWESQKFWLALAGIVGLVLLGALGRVELSGLEIAGIVSSAILGRAWEGAAARKAGYKR